MTPSDFLLREISLLSRRPRLDELVTRIRARGRPTGRIDSAAAVRAEREPPR